MSYPSAYSLRQMRAEIDLDAHDPHWRERFQSDWRRAEDFYFRPKYDVISGGREQPNELVRRYEPDPDEQHDSFEDTL